MPDVREHWREDLVGFLIGCSFTFEDALAAAGVPVRHVEQGVNVPMFRTSRRCRPAGAVSGPLVVSMRMVPEALVTTAVEVPDYGDAVRGEPGDVPVFWACGVTPQAAVVESRPPLAIAHAPGHMLITDVRDADYRV